MRVVLATPPFDLIRKGYGSRLKIKSGFLPPLGMGYVAASLLQAGHDVALVDSSPLYDTADEAARAILAHNPEVVGLSVLSTNAPEAYALAREIRSQSGVPIILGGPHGTSFAEKTLEDCEAIDATVIGEGELTAVDLLAELQTHGRLQAVPGSLVRQADGTIADGGRRPVVMNLDELPMPARHLYDHRLYRPLPNQCLRTPATSMMTSRDCAWGKCTFCYQGSRQRFRRSSPERAFREVEWCVRDFGIREISFWDDIFALNERWVTRFCDLLQASGLDVIWTAYAKADTVTPTMLKRMAEAGCHSIYLGIESAHQEILDRVKKGVTVEEIRNAVKWAHEVGIAVRASFIVGWPGETPEMGMDTGRFAVDLDLDYAQFHPYHPMWETKLAETCAEDGIVGDVTAYGGLHTSRYAPYTYGSFARVEEVVRWNYNNFYFRWGYVLKHLKRIRSYADAWRYFEGFRLWLGLTMSMHAAKAERAAVKPRPSPQAISGGLA